VDDPAWAQAGPAHPSGGVRVDVMLNDRAPRTRDGRLAVADADGRLDALFAGLAGHFLLLRPDRIVAAAFRPADAERVAAQLRRYQPAGRSALPSVRIR
jgi:3-(3-hydroxy-phenyl)propionate hydroxylase